MNTKWKKTLKCNIAAALVAIATLALSNSTYAQSITAVSPNTAAQGTENLTITFTLNGMLPPGEVMPESAMIGTISGTAVARPTETTVTAVFDVAYDEATGSKTATVNFSGPQGIMAFSMANGFTVTAGADTAPVITGQPKSATVYEGFAATLSLAAYGSDPLTYQWQKNLADLVGETSETYFIAATAVSDEGDYRCIVSNGFGSETSTTATLSINTNEYPSATGFSMVDTMQENNFSATATMTAPAPGAAFAGQDAQYAGNAMDYTQSGDGLTVYDNNTGLTWTRTSDTNRDGEITATDKLTYNGLFTYADSLNAEAFGGFTDWRVPSITETYSLMDFRGIDPSGYESTDTSGLIPFIDDDTFDFAYGDTAAGERIIDSQYGGTSLYVDGEQLLFGVNAADGRIKGYGLTLFGSDKTFCALFCRGNEEYGINDFEAIGTDVVIDHATGLMWQQADSVDALNWEEALAYAEGLELGGYRDWRLPNAKELQGLVDYTRSPGTTDSAAIDPVFSCTSIINEAGQADFPWYWTGTTHENWENASWAAYIAFGRAMGYDSTGGWTDVHGAGCQRSDPKSGTLSDYTNVGNGYYNTLAPQGDAIRIDNHVRCVRGGAEAPTTDSDADGLTDWYEYNYSSSTTAMEADGDDDLDGASNAEEQAAGTVPTDDMSMFLIVEFTLTDGTISWTSELDRSYTLQGCSDLETGTFETIESGIPTTAPLNTYELDESETATFYRILVD